MLIEIARGSEPTLELLRFFDANRYTMLPLDEIAGRLMRDPALLREPAERLQAAGFLRTDGRARIFVLTTDVAKLDGVASLVRLIQDPAVKAKLASGGDVAK